MLMADAFDTFYPLNTQGVSALSTMDAVFQQYLRIITAPLEIFFNTVKYFKVIYHLMIGSVTCGFSSDMGCLGYNMGQIVYRVFYKTRST